MTTEPSEAGAEPAPSALARAAVLGLALALSFAAHSPSLAHWFVRDDFVWLREASEGLGLRSYGYLRPVSNTWFWLEHQLFGEQASPYYLLRILLHAWNACWLGALVGRVHRSYAAGALTVLLFTPLSGSAASVHWGCCCKCIMFLNR